MDQDVDRRVRIIAELLRKRELLPPSDPHTTNNHHEFDTEDYLPIDELADRVNLSPDHLRALFSRDLKMTPRRFAKLLKMVNAIILVENPRMTISKIVERVRGGDESHFQRDFKKTFGKPLGEFRRLHLQQSEKGQEGSGE
jgi:AraC-like DNA-binding protein